MELQGKRVAVLVIDNYEDLELWYPTLRLREAGAEVSIVGTGASAYTSKHGIPIQADATAEQVRAEDFDALIIPGTPSPENMPDNPVLTELVYAAIQQGKVIAAVCTAGRSMVAAHPGADERAVRLFTMQDDVVKDEGPYQGSAVIREGSLIMARTPVDLPAFCRMIIAALAEPPAPTAAH
jgi:protease I